MKSVHQKIQTIRMGVSLVLISVLRKQKQLFLLNLGFCIKYNQFQRFFFSNQDIIISNNPSSSSWIVYVRNVKNGMILFLKKSEIHYIL